MSSPANPVPSTARPLVLAVQGELLGRGEHDELGRILVRNFFHTLAEAAEAPDVAIFINGGVKLVAQGSPVLEDLRALAERGVRLLACGTCLGYYNLKEQVAVGEISNMYAITETLVAAARVISL